jgi:hypothetical protein
MQRQIRVLRPAHVLHSRAGPERDRYQVGPLLKPKHELGGRAPGGAFRVDIVLAAHVAEDHPLRLHGPVARVLKLPVVGRLLRIVALDAYVSASIVADRDDAIAVGEWREGVAVFGQFLPQRERLAVGQDPLRRGPIPEETQILFIDPVTTPRLPLRIHPACQLQLAGSGRGQRWAPGGSPRGGVRWHRGLPRAGLRGEIRGGSE